MLNSSLHPPYIHHWNTAKLNERILLAVLCSVILWAFVLHGMNVLFITAFGLLGALVATLFARFIFKHEVRNSGSVLWSLLVIAIFPISTPVYIPFVTVFITIFLFGSFLGGRENNSFNIPAFGSLFAYLAWPYTMAGYALTRIGSSIEAITAATPIQKLSTVTSLNMQQGDGFSLLQEIGFKLSKTDKSITDYLNTVFFNDLKSNLPYGFFDFFFGARGTTIIESGLFIILIGTIILVAFGYYKYISSFFATLIFFVLVMLFGLRMPGEEVFHGNVLLAAVNHGILPSMLIYSIYPENGCIGRLGQLLCGMILGIVAYIMLYFKAGNTGMFLAICTVNIFMIIMKNRDLLSITGQGTMNEK